MLRPTLAFLVAAPLATACMADSAPTNCVAGPFAQGSLTRLPGDWAAPATVQAEAQKDLPKPPEIARIRAGAISFYQGGYINDGIINWMAYDAEREVFIAVLGGAGPRLNDVPKADNLQPGQFVRRTTAAGYPRSEFVTVVAATPEQRDAMTCALNALANDPPAPLDNGLRFRRPPNDTLAIHLAVLRDGAPATSGDSPARDGLERSTKELISQALEPQLRKANRY